jgi:site-specific DNA-cytosine methylase
MQNEENRSIEKGDSIESSRNQDVLCPISLSRWERYEESKRSFRDGCPPEVFFERGANAITTPTEKLSEPISNCLRTNYSNGHSNETYIRQLNNPTHSNNRLYSEEGISPSLNTAQGGNRQPKIPTDSRIRRLTPTECERLMSWPDGWTKYGINEKGEKVEISDSQRYKMCGNGVVSKVVEEVFKNIICKK